MSHAVQGMVRWRLFRDGGGACRRWGVVGLVWIVRAGSVVGALVREVELAFERV